MKRESEPTALLSGTAMLSISPKNRRLVLMLTLAILHSP